MNRSGVFRIALGVLVSIFSAVCGSSDKVPGFSAGGEGGELFESISKGK